MLIVYDSLSGNVERFVNKLPSVEAIKITPGLKIDRPYILVTYTAKIGEVPATVEQFLKENANFLQGVAASGNKIWGKIEKGGTYCKSADTIALMYSVPIILKFEMSGLKKDIDTFMERVRSFETH